MLKFFSVGWRQRFFNAARVGRAFLTGIACIVLLFSANAAPAQAGVVSVVEEPAFQGPQPQRLVPPQPLEPVNEVTVAPPSVTFRWSAVAGAAGYELFIGKGFMAPEERRKVTATNNSVTVSDLAPGQYYTWSVRALHPSDPMRHSIEGDVEVFLFNEGPIAPVTPTATVATDGEYHEQVKVSWSITDYYPLYYEILRKDLTTNETVVAGTIADGFVEYFDTPPVIGRHYLYTVRACHLNGCSAPSAGDEGWAAECAAPPAPKLLSPANGATVQYYADEETFGLSWEPVPNVREYLVEVWDPATGNHFVRELVTMPSFEVWNKVGLMAWKVTALGPSGCRDRTASETRTFTAVRLQPGYDQNRSYLPITGR